MNVEVTGIIFSCAAVAIYIVRCIFKAKGIKIISPIKDKFFSEKKVYIEDNQLLFVLMYAAIPDLPSKFIISLKYPKLSDLHRLIDDHPSLQMLEWRMLYTLAQGYDQLSWYQIAEKYFELVYGLAPRKNDEFTGLLLYQLNILLQFSQANNLLLSEIFNKYKLSNSVSVGELKPIYSEVIFPEEFPKIKIVEQ